MSQSHLARVLSHLQPADHLCWAYQDESERQEAVDLCLRTAGELGAPLRVLAGGEPVADPKAWLPEQALSPAEVRAHTLASLAQIEHEAPGAWVLAELSSASAGSEMELLSWLQTLWCEATARSLVLIEFYGRRHLSLELFVALLHSHRLIAWEGHLYQNEMAPEKPLDDAAPVAERRITRFLENLGHWGTMRAKLEQQVEELNSLYELSLAVSSLDMDELLRLVGDHIVHLFRPATTVITLLDEKQEMLRLAYIEDRGQHLEPIMAPLKDGGGLTMHVLRTAQPLLVNDLQAPGALPASPVHIGDPARSWLGVPMLARGRGIGVISVQAYTPAAFDPEDQRLLSLLAQIAASALEKAQLFQETLALERRYHTLLEEMNDGYAVFQENRLAFANARLGQLLGRSHQSLLGCTLQSLHTIDEWPQGAGAVERLGRLEGDVVQYRSHFRCSDGSALPVEVTLDRIEYEGRPALALLCRDISRQAQLEAQLLQADKLSAVGQLVAGVAHELNNPLTTIKGYTQLLQLETLPPAVADDLRRVEHAADRCQRIVRDLLTFARHYEPLHIETDVNELLRNTISLRAYEMGVHNITVQWELDPLLPAIMADPHRLQRVMLNLIMNAEQALLETQNGGQIVIQSCALPDGKHIRFAVSDNGPGIRPEHLGRIFDPFFTTKEAGAGTGLGLSISYGIISEHGGRIWAESPEGSGATFYVELPIASEGSA